MAIRFATLAFLICWTSCRSLRAESIKDYCPRSVDATPSPNSLDVRLGARIAEMVPLLTPASAKIATEFYGACGFQPAWMHEGRPTVAGNALLEVFRKVSLRGLDESGYSVPANPTAAEEAGSTKGLLAAVNFELRVTVAAMRLTKDLHCGRLDPHEAHADLLPNCASFDPVKFVWHVAQSQFPAAEFDWLEPPAPGYQRTKQALQHYIPLTSNPEIVLLPVVKSVNPGDPYAGVAALRAVLIRDGDLAPHDTTGPSSVYDESTAAAVKSFQHRHGLSPDGVLNAETYRQLSVPISDRVAQLQLTLERWRWVSQAFAEPPVVVNIPEYKLRAYDAKLNVVLAMEVIVGGAYHRQTPVFQNQISSIIFRPYWNIPQNIQRREMEPAMRRDASYLQKHDYEKVGIPGKGFRIRQRPGDRNALGLIKFSLPNRYDIYLHGTPLPKLFEKTRRDFSHGCIRLQDPAALALWALGQNGGWTKEKIDAAMHGTQTITISLPHPIPVLIVYATAFAGEDNVVYFLPDIYSEDKGLAILLKEAAQLRNEGNEKHSSVLSLAINKITGNEKLSALGKDLGQGSGASQ